MASERHDIDHVRGEDAVYRITVTDDDGDTVDLSSAVIYFRVKTALSASTLSISKSSATSTEINVLSPQSTTTNKGRADIYVDQADTSTLSAGTYYYDVWVTDSSGDDTAVIKPSKFRIERAITEGV